MTRLRDFSWWPIAWIDEIGGSPNPSVIRKSAVLTNVRRSGNKLILIVQHNGVICTAQIGSEMSERCLVLLRHILLQHWGELISAVEDLEVNLGILK